MIWKTIKAHCAIKVKENILLSHLVVVNTISELAKSDLGGSSKTIRITTPGLAPRPHVQFFLI